MLCYTVPCYTGPPASKQKGDGRFGIEDGGLDPLQRGVQWIGGAVDGGSII